MDLNAVYILMQGQDIYSDIYYTDKKEAEKDVKRLNEGVQIKYKFWVKTLQYRKEALSNGI
jgi:hypothetical protein